MDATAKKWKLKLKNGCSSRKMDAQAEKIDAEAKKWMLKQKNGSSSRKMDVQV
jgi:hypothetical protein